MDDERTDPYQGEPGPVAGLGVQLGRYVVQGVVGAGGTGLVVAARDLELGRLVAIKVVTSDHGEARGRLVREAQAMARLSHPNVVTVHEVLRLGERAGIVMELVDGDNLATWRERAPRSWREIVAAYVQAARGLAAAHRAGLVHRDFKPSNALIDRDGVVRVTDFGLVRSDGVSDGVADDEAGAEAGALDLALTRTGALMGTPAYMAPEQHRSAAVDARTDQWALGCSLYTALYGQRPFAGESRGGIAAEVLAGRIRSEPVDTDVPRRIRAAVRRALAVDPADRFGSMEDLVASLQPARRAWQIAAAAGAVVVAAAVTAVIALGQGDGATCAGLEAPLTSVWNAPRSGALRARLIAPGGHSAGAADRVVAALDGYGARWLAARTTACTEARQGVGSPDRLDRRMGCLHQRLVEMTTVVDALGEADAELLRGASQAVDRLHPVADCDDPRDPIPRPADPGERARIAAAEESISRGWAYHGLGRCERALPLARQAAEAGERTDWAPLRARALLLRGECEDRALDHAAALATFDQAATLGARAKDDAAVAEALTHRFLVIGEHLGRPGEAMAGRRFIEVALERAGSPPLLRATWLHFLAIMLLAERKLDEALAAEVEAVASWRRIVPAGHTYLVDSLQTLGNIHVAREELDRAEALAREVLAARIAATGPDHIAVAQALINVGIVEAERGEPVAAIRSWERASSTARAAGVEHFLAAVNLGRLRLEIGQWRAAAEDLTAALAIAQREAPGGSRWVGVAASSLGAATMALGDLDRAGSMLDLAIATRREIKSPSLAGSLALASRLALLRGDRASARARLAEAKSSSSGTGSLVALAEAELARAEAGCPRARPLYQTMVDEARKEPEVTPSSEVNEAIAGLAECLLESGRAAEAVAALEPTVAWLDRVGADAGAAARARFILARGLVASRGDRVRARALAEAARSGFATLGEPGQRRATEVVRWLARAR